MHCMDGDYSGKRQAEVRHRPGDSPDPILRRLKSHPTAAELHARLLGEHENLSQKTVYEILDALVLTGLASRVMAVGEPYRYEARSEPHHHAEV